MNPNLEQILQKTSLVVNDRALLGKYLQKAFDENKSDAVESETILSLAWKFQVPQFDEMFEDHQNFEYPPFNC
ncbi:hypothetical protein [Flavobacterium anhuiense]|uniref:hypothetical protein n=1 Tax=Flavobacterium anhuiense TaxID=459526 RepID=UPI0020272FD0|nr:hypothetical protein [Flavobacterium anhuiense]URM37192.1 hypothetical protein LLY39_00945 [Flavobacterium anhuiense]